ncbi:MAG: NAD-dependent epimerase/dehydratase family protein [Candidatus Magasanikbacteria bacterium]|nr:NAD-dependent epimerase/dehydratase family protein [Candidatus Magasanikbacteria bacterium]
MAKYLVTGGAGFIGTNLVKKLLEDNHVVTVIDNYASGRLPDRVLAGAEYIEADIRDFNAVKQACQGVDGIFHLAALPRVLFSVEHPLATHDVNINGTFNVLLAARDTGVKRVVFSTSSAAYGDQAVYPLKEDGIIKKPVSPYGFHKLVGEEYCRLFSELYKLETVSLCYFNIYGPHFDPKGAYALVIGRFLKLRQEGKPLTVRGDGEMFRDYTHVFDAVTANILAMTKNTVGHGEVINIGYGEPHSVNEIVKLIGGDFVFVDPLPGEMKFTHADNSKARELLGWQPTIDLAEGIARLKQEWHLD